MMERPAHLPDFKTPPLVEVVVGIQFARLKAMGVVHLGRVQRLFSDQFPTFEDRPRLDPGFEIIGPAVSTIKLEIGAGAPQPPRLWLWNEMKTQLIQIQSDRFILNWRRVDLNHQYPHFEDIYEQFNTYLGLFTDFLETENIGSIRVNQCEINYINQIRAMEGDDLWADPSVALRIANQSDWADPETPPEDLRLQVRNVLVRNDEELGRLIVDCQPARSAEDEQILHMSVAVRGRPWGGSLSEINEFIFWGREKIVHRFVNVTTKRYQEYWGRKN